MIPAMVITDHRRRHGYQSTIYMCPYHFPPPSTEVVPASESIPEYLSDKEALNAGWSIIKTWWVCPKCTSERKKWKTELKSYIFHRM